nr:four-helix bundle copper-binding protein [Superficieibacter sp.]
MDQDALKCIELCYKCAAMCDFCAASCLRDEDPGRMTECIRLAVQSAGICRLTAQFMSLESPYFKQLCRICVDICKSCAEECAKHQNDHCQRCAKTCRYCADACLRMVA